MLTEIQFIVADLRVTLIGTGILHLLLFALLPGFPYQCLQVLRRLLLGLDLISMRNPLHCLGHDEHLELLSELNMEEAKLLGEPLTIRSLA